MRLIRSGGLGAFEVSVNTLRSEGGAVNSSDESDDDLLWRGSHRARTPPSPAGLPLSFIFLLYFIFISKYLTVVCTKQLLCCLSSQ